MIVTLTANPSLDRTIILDEPLRPGAVQTALTVREDAGGKGINVTRVLQGSGLDSRAILPLDPTDSFGEALRTAGVDTVPVAVRGAARANLTIADPDGLTTKVNLPGVGRAPQDAEALIEAVVEASMGARWLVLAGSLPPGFAEDFYVHVIRAVRASLADAPRIAVDVSGPALRAVVASGAPDLIKPNEEELAELAGVELDPDAPLPEQVAAIAARLVPTRVASAFVTLGGAGAVLVTAQGAWHGTPPPTRVRSTVGAGDSSLAGFLLAESHGADAQECLRSGIRYGSAAAALPGTQAPTPADLLPGDVPVRTIP